jgi:hypothetical protein
MLNLIIGLTLGLLSSAPPAESLHSPSKGAATSAAAVNVILCRRECDEDGCVWNCIPEDVFTGGSTCGDAPASCELPEGDVNLLAGGKVWRRRGGLWRLLMTIDA